MTEEKRPDNATTGEEKPLEVEAAGNRPIPVEVQDMFSEIREGEKELILDPYKESHPEDAEEMQRAFDEYARVNEELFIESGGTALFGDVKKRIPNNRFIILAEEVVRLAAPSAAGTTERVIQEIKGIIGKLLRRFKNN